MSARVALVMGSDSDWKVMQAAKETLLAFDEVAHTQVVSAHRTPEELGVFTQWAQENGIKVIIAAAGGAAHLPGMLASYTTSPVIGVPINTTSLNGLDSLLSIVQMPKGIPVATVAIDNAVNAALLALRMLAIEDKQLAVKLGDYRQKMCHESKAKSKNLI